jgi:glycine/D-amino acid oxidase-like deaminating enzyme
VVVVGAGVFGAAGALELRRRGWDTTLLDPHPLPYHGAASTDVSKVVRLDYGSDRFYHELAELALEGWDRWNAEWPRPFFHETGLLVLARGPMEPGGFEHESRRVLVERGYEVERLTEAFVQKRLPAWRAGAYADGYFNPRGGWAESGAVVERLVALGEAEGVRRRAAGFADLLERGSRVGGVRTQGGEEIAADRVVVCTGAWTPTLLPWLGDTLRAVAQPVLHFRPRDAEAFRGAAFPTWTADIANSGWYGFPALPNGDVKIGHHGPGTAVQPDARGEVPREHVERTRAFLREAIPGLADAPVLRERVCLYCDAPDGDFLIDGDPEREGLSVASGGSGHAFKFAPVLGALVADAVEGRSGRWSSRFRWREPKQAREEARFTGE